MKDRLLANMLFALAFVAFNSQCTRKIEKSRQLLELEMNFQKAQEEILKYDAKIKAASGDEGLIMQYNYDKELAKSRAERLKEQLKAMNPIHIDESATSNGGHRVEGH